MVLLAVGLGRDAERGDLNRGRKTVETRRVIGQQPGARTLVGRNMGKELKECLIGMRLLDVKVRPVGAPVRAALDEHPAFDAKGSPELFQGLDRSRLRLEGRRFDREPGKRRRK